MESGRTSSVRATATASAVAMMLWVGASPAAAQTGEMTLSPGEVGGPGEVTVTASATGLAPDTAVFLIPCAPPASLNVEDIEAADCDASNLVPLTTDSSGSASGELTVDVPAEGVAISMGTPDRSTGAAKVLSVSVPATTTAAATTTVATDDSPSTTTPTSATTTPPAGTTTAASSGSSSSGAAAAPVGAGSTGQLPRTGPLTEPGWPLGIALVLIGAGVLLVPMARLRRQR